MKISKLSKFALPAVLLTAGMLAYADGEVTLRKLGNTVISWSDFVTSINTNTPPEGTTDEYLMSLVPATDATKVAYNSAVDKKAEADNAVKEQTSELNSKISAKENEVAENGPLQNAISIAEDEVITANKNLKDYINNTVTPAKTAYDNAEANLAQWNTEIAGYRNDVTRYSGQVTLLGTNREEAEREVASAEETIKAGIKVLTDTLDIRNNVVGVAEANLTKLQEKLDGLPKKTVTVGWLKTIETAATNFSNSFNDKTDGQTIYYKFTEEYEEMDDEYQVVLYIAYSATNGYSGPITQSGLRKLFSATGGEDGGNGALYKKKITQLYVYLGQDYANSTEAKSPILSAAAGTITNSTIPALAMNAVSSLARNSDYKITSDEVQDAYKSQETQLNKEIKDLSSDIAAYKTNKITAQENLITEENKKLTDPDPDSALAKARKNYTEVNTNYNTARTNLSNANKGVEETQAKIDGYTKVPAGSAEGSVSEQTRLKNAYDSAVSGQETYDDAVSTAEGKVTAANENLETAKSELADLNKQLDALTSAVTAAEEEVTAAQKNVVAAGRTQYMTNFVDIILNDNVTVTTPINVNFTGSIRGNNKVITLDGAEAIFAEDFKGTLLNAAINGQFALGSISGASFENVVSWNGTAGAIYDDHSVRTPYTSLETLGFAAREKYGVTSLANTGKLTNLDEDNTTKVYSINIYSSVTGTAPQSYILIGKDGKMTNSAGAYSLPENTFAKSATTDIADRKLTNVFYGDSENDYECDNVVLTDGFAFYCPAKFRTTEVTYTRNLEEGYNAVCLPFAVNGSMFEDNDVVDAICKYDREDTKKFWFTKVDGDLDANTPALIHATKAGSFTLTGNMEFAQTPENQLVKGGTFAGDDFQSQSHGTFKRVNAGEFLGASQGEKIYGLRKSAEKGDYFQLAVSTGQVASQAHFNPFRIAISSVITPSSPGVGAPDPNPGIRGIGIQDENGHDITDDIVLGVKNISNDVYTPGIYGGQGEIIINSDADFGTVEIFTIDGKMVAAAKVNAGTTTVNVEKGLYIVMGKKVMVK